VPDASLGRRALAEFVGTALLVATVVGSGIAADRLTDDSAVTLLVNSWATAGVLFVLILTLGAVSGAHFNPVVTLAARAEGWIGSRAIGAYIAVQVLGALAGAVLANVMFDVSATATSSTERGDPRLRLAELVATAGLVLVIVGLSRAGRAAAIPACVAGYIGAAYFFTSSTSFANPAVTAGRSLTDSYSGIQPGNIWIFAVMQLAGGTTGYVLARLLYPNAVEAA
jgi:arsenate reductase